jgi:hypothetical protein
MNVVTSMSQEILDVWEKGVKSDGSVFTESGKNGPVEASDATIIEIQGKLFERLSRMAKVELEITDQDFVHWDECKIYFGNVMKAISKIIDNDELFNKALLEVSTIKEPGRGRRKRR